MTSVQKTKNEIVQHRKWGILWLTGSNPQVREDISYCIISYLFLSTYNIQSLSSFANESFDIDDIRLFCKYLKLKKRT